MRKRIGAAWGLRLLAAAILGSSLLGITSCADNGHNSDQQIQQRAQEATEQAKIAAAKAAAEARSAAANATRDARDVAKGVRQGLHQHGTDAAAGLVNINTASTGQLERLRGVNAATARRIQAERPYRRPHDLVRKGAISESEYDRIAGDVVAH